MSRILVITYYYPPSTASGANRWAAMVRHMRLLGHHVWVVTSASAGSEPGDAAEGVIRAGDLVTSPLLRRGLGRPPLASPGETGVEKPAPALLTRVVVPDAYLASWVPAAVVRARRAIAEHGIECVFTSGPPDSTHLAGLLLGRRRPAWIADFRDGWTSMTAPWPTGAQRRLDRWMERAVATRADRVIGATRPIAEDLERRLGVDAAWVTNGWDPHSEGDVEAAATRLPPRDERFVRVVHTGTLRIPRGRDPGVFLEALRAYNEGAPPRPVQLVLAGRLSGEDAALVADERMREWVQHVGVLDRAASVALQRTADALLLVTGSDSAEATGKLFEYLASGRPIVALARGNEAARIVEATGTGVVVAPDHRAAIEATLARLATGGLAAEARAGVVDQFVYPGPARAALELADQAIAQRSQRRRRL